MADEKPPEEKHKPEEKLIVPDLSIALAELRAEMQKSYKELAEMIRKGAPPPAAPPAPAPSPTPAPRKPWWDISDAFGG